MPQLASRRLRYAARPAIAACILILAGACTAAPAATGGRNASGASAITSAPRSSSASKPRAVKSTPTHSATRSVPSTQPAPQVPTGPSGTGPVIVLDPGHAPAFSHTDPATGLRDSDYENEPEMRDVFDVAQLVRAKLLAAGYRVVMTKNSLYDQVSLGQRAAIANNAHAALALSIHDQAGSGGGIGFDQGNNIVYYQSVGDYRETPSGTKVEFTDSGVAATSRRYGQIFQNARQAVEGFPITLQGNTGYDLGSRGLAGGDIWIVQLLSKVPWIYNESGGNSPGMSGLNAADKQRYADGLVAAVERCVPAR